MDFAPVKTRSKHFLIRNVHSWGKPDYNRGRWRGDDAAKTDAKKDKINEMLSASASAHAAMVPGADHLVMFRKGKENLAIVHTTGSEAFNVAK